jgi:hypothetical protein
MWQQPRCFNPALASQADTMRDTTSGLNGPKAATYDGSAIKNP